jgi:hypothetical protein
LQGGAVIVVLGWQFGGAMGGSAAVVLALITALYGLHERELLRRRNVEGAAAEVADAERPP